jgi:hypothetical protein
MGHTSDTKNQATGRLTIAGRLPNSLTPQLHSPRIPCKTMAGYPNYFKKFAVYHKNKSPSFRHKCLVLFSNIISNQGNIYMTEKTNGFNASFNELFCGHLEFYLCRTFENSTAEELRGFWCDGVSWAPYFNPELNKDHLSITKVVQSQEIITRAKMGVSGQDYYDMVLKLGPRSLSNYQQGLSLINCLPSDESMQWIHLDIENKKIELQLL